MSNPPDVTSHLALHNPGAMLPVDPFRSLAVHFGMLLGVDDFETMDAYHRGKMWLHTAWLHGEGVIWGFGVTFDAERGELRVDRGLALDAAGRELHLEADACLSLARWYAEHADDPDLDVTVDNDGTVHFAAHVCLRFKGCLTRQVPALVEPCAGSGQTTAPSRVFETVALSLRPGLPPEPPTPPAPGVSPYHRLRLYFGLDEPVVDETTGEIIASDVEVLDELRRIAQLPPHERVPASSSALRRFAAQDAVDLQPEAARDGASMNWFPSADPGCLVLARLPDITLVPDGANGGLAAQSATIDIGQRPTHVATSTIQDLLASLTGNSVAALLDARGPRIDPGSVTIDAQSIVLTADQELLAASVQEDAFEVRVLDQNQGWVKNPSSPILAEDGKKITLALDTAVNTGSLVRIIARGTGPTPILGANGHVPLAGSPADGPATIHNGNDFVHIQERQ